MVELLTIVVIGLVITILFYIAVDQKWILNTAPRRESKHGVSIHGPNNPDFYFDILHTDGNAYRYDATCPPPEMIKPLDGKNRTYTLNLITMNPANGQGFPILLHNKDLLIRAEHVPQLIDGHIIVTIPNDQKANSKEVLKEIDKAELNLNQVALDEIKRMSKHPIIQAMEKRHMTSELQNAGQREAGHENVTETIAKILDAQKKGNGDKE